jgi:hypothetical protein
MHLPPSAQAVQALPLAPHAVSMVPGKHVPPLVHPVQTHCFVIEQVSPLAAHETHAAPPLPHASFASPIVQVFPVQQPMQENMSQTHVPAPTHSCPWAQGGPEACT